jgi:hypothetical protein
MNVASVTVRAIAQRFARGFQSASSRLKFACCSSYVWSSRLAVAAAMVSALDSGGTSPIHFSSPSRLHFPLAPLFR